MPAELNAKSQVLKMLQRHHPEYHPLIELANIALDSTTDVRLKVDCHKTIVKYCEPELKSVEVSGRVDGNFGMLRVIIDNGESGETPFGESLSTHDETIAD